MSSGGLLVFFPSYQLLSSYKSKWKKTHLLNYLENPIFDQSQNYETLTSKYLQHIRNGSKSILFSVCRGKLSEGVDFKDEQCRAVIMVGLPFRNFTAETVILKKHFLDSKAMSEDSSLRMSGQQWYELDCL